MFSTFTRYTPLTPPDVAARLASEVSRVRLFRTATTPFLGVVSASGFRIVRTPKGRDSFNPVLYGRLSRADRGTVVRVVSTLHPVVWVLLVAWTILFFHLAATELEPPMLLYFSALAPWLMALGFYPTNARQSRELLEARLGLSLDPPNSRTHS